MYVRKDLQMSEYYLDWTLNRNPKKNKYDELKDISSFEKYMLFVISLFIDNIIHKIV